MTEQALTGVGAALKRAREAAGLAVPEVARQLKLLPRQIDSLEHERFDRLPGPTIARGMVRNYAQLLKLDPEPFVERMTPSAERAPDPPGARHGEPAPSSAPERRATLFYVTLSVALLVVAGVVAYEWQAEEPAPQPVAALSPPAPQPAPAPAPAPPPAPAPAIEETPIAIEVPAEQPVETPQAAPQPALPAGGHRLVLRMQEEAWLEVSDGAGRSLVYSLNPAGSERIVSGQPPFQLVIGNAPHVELTYDGRPVDLVPHTRGSSEVARFTLQ